MSHVSRLTPTGRGAVATLRLSGLDALESPSALFVAANGRRLRDQTLNRSCFGRWGTDVPEDVVVFRIDEDTVEVHCHGGDAAISRILADLQSRGVEAATKSGTVQRSPGDMLSAGEIECRCRQLLSLASTLRTADILWDQCEGRLAAALEGLQRGSETDVVESARQLLRWSRFGHHLTRPWRIVLAGRPNVGKSSLINALVGYGRSIVYDQPGTTRDVVTVETALDGWPFEFCDTAGLRREADELESAGIARARALLDEADLPVVLLDVSQPAHVEDEQLLAECSQALVVAHKADLPVSRSDIPETAMQVSATSGEGVEELAAAIVDRLIPEVPPPGTLVPVDPQMVEYIERFITA